MKFSIRVVFSFILVERALAWFDFHNLLFHVHMCEVNEVQCCYESHHLGPCGCPHCGPPHTQHIHFCKYKASICASFGVYDSQSGYVNDMGYDGNTYGDNSTQEYELNANHGIPTCQDGEFPECRQYYNGGDGELEATCYCANTNETMHITCVEGDASCQDLESLAHNGKDSQIQSTVRRTNLMAIFALAGTAALLVGALIMRRRDNDDEKETPFLYDSTQASSITGSVARRMASFKVSNLPEAHASLNEPSPTNFISINSNLERSRTGVSVIAADGSIELDGPIYLSA